MCCIEGAGIKTVLKNQRYLRALFRQPVDRTPVWLMRQAGRYLPEYRLLRAQVGDFTTLYRDPDLACEVALLPLRRFELDAAIVFSDILTIPDAMGLQLCFVPGVGPRFQRTLCCKADIQRLPIPDPEGKLAYVMTAVQTLRRALNNRIPLIGFAGSPWTLAAYMVQGGKSPVFNCIKELVKNDPVTLHLLLDKLAQSVTHYLNGQIVSGAQAVIVFDSWGGLLDSEEQYQQFSLTYLQQVFSGLIRMHDQQRVPVTLFSRGTDQWLESMASSGCDALSIDWEIDLGEARRRVGDQVAIQGNLHPELLAQATFAKVRQHVEQLLASYGYGSGHIFSLGHGVLPETPPDRVQWLVEAVHTLSPTYHG